MPFSNIASRIDTPGFNAPPPAVNVALQAMEAIYNGSPGAAAAMEGWLQNHPGQNIIIQFLAGTAQAPLPLGGGVFKLTPPILNRIFTCPTTELLYLIRSYQA
ncbi:MULTISPECIES: hypothetical protein [unclassified Citromicrobium]|uniref:hypothetical protein n=1 Tax=unclassified Citromicrobium TaxID=2630544 RepID=UPI000A9E94BA|nr:MULTISPECIES: hypothetical protein [unclassified Citromicrobium]HAG55363.1 hypothetical protein [Dehalococcoidia bacterium]|tara:strand:- start:2262 stop:2570 length:309 start_codon:yes stop_codon:yes gene_type:complete